MQLLSVKQDTKTLAYFFLKNKAQFLISDEMKKLQIVHNDDQI